MSGLFLKLLNMSISASVLIVVVVLARCLLRRSPKWIHCILWALVGIRLLCPFQLETTFSLAPNAQVVSIEAGAVTSQVLAEMPALDNTANRYLAKYYFEGITVPEQETAQNPMNLIASVWLCGVAVLLVYAAVSYVHIRRKVRESVRIEGNIYICDRIQTPFIFGVLNPRIYLPSSLKEVQIKNVVAHEKAHIRRLDYIVSGTEFDEAYPQINGTPMDYTVNGMYDALVMNSLLSSSMLYQNLKDPVLAAKYLLNLLDNENKVQVEALQDGSKEGINIKITFIEDGAERFVKMIQPDSEDGIWIPQDYE